MRRSRNERKRTEDKSGERGPSNELRRAEDADGRRSLPRSRYPVLRVCAADTHSSRLLKGGLITLSHLEIGQKSAIKVACVRLSARPKP